MTTTAQIEPFRIGVPQGDLDDLAARLAATRWPGELAGAGTAYGMPLGTVQRLAERWRTGCDWRESVRPNRAGTARGWRGRSPR